MKTHGSKGHTQFFSNTGIGNAPQEPHRSQNLLQKQIGTNAENHIAQQEKLSKQRERLQKKLDKKKQMENDQIQTVMVILGIQSRLASNHSR